MSVVGGALGKFHYSGPVSSSKSLYNRALIVNSFFPQLQLNAHSECDDVQKMIAAMKDLSAGKKELDCGDAGTVLRFLSFRVSREEGVFRLRGTPRLFQRPQKELLFILNQLGVSAELLPTELVIRSQGWKRPLMPIQINRENSSQFATGVLMSAWKMDFDLEIQLYPNGLNDAYWNMSFHFAKQLGMEIQQKEKDSFFIPRRQEINQSEVSVEPDYSSVFAVAATAAIVGEAHITGVRGRSLQPDHASIQILKDLRIPVDLENQTLSVMRAGKISPIQLMIGETPDLFPVLAILCAFSHGECQLTGAPRLVHKESNRIKKTAELLRLMGVKTKTSDDGIIIWGKGDELKPQTFEFNPDHDHRMAMAAGILMRAGWPIRLKTPEVVKKSFPEFWQILGIKP